MHQLQVGELLYHEGRCKEGNYLCCLHLDIIFARRERRAQAIALHFGAVMGDCLCLKLESMKLPNKISVCRN